ALTYNMHPNPSIKFESLIEASPYVLLPKDDPFANRKSISLKQLANKDMVALNLPITQQYFLSLFSGVNLNPKIKHQVKSYELVRSLVGAGEGYALLIMRPVNERAYDGSELVYVPLHDDVPIPQYGLAVTNRSVPTKLIATFADVCRQTLKQEKSAENYCVKLPEHALS
ncbi:MAG: LysR substrate-binding domain-containing protein, partial [Pseudomonadota bacterium]